MKTESLKRLAALFREASRIAVLTGAGMSTESGIPDFRSANGLYAAGVGEDIFCIERFDRDPARFYRWLAGFWPLAQGAVPHAGHRALAELGRRPGKQVSVCTQNIDGLHEAAGSTAVFRLHGTLQTATCRRCNRRQPAADLQPPIASGHVPRHTACGGVFKPDIVFFGEPLPEREWAGARDALARSDLVVVAGTSLTVYPAASLPGFRPAASRLVILNRTDTALDAEADLIFRQNIGPTLSQAMALL